jgi:hypothetical protein
MGPLAKRVLLRPIMPGKLCVHDSHQRRIGLIGLEESTLFKIRTPCVAK